MNSELYHDQANDKVWSNEMLMDEAIRLGNVLREGYLSGERRAQVSRAMSRVAFEQFMRFQENKATMDEV